MSDTHNNGNRNGSGTARGPEPIRIWAGKGSGEVCAQCGQAIRPDDYEYELTPRDGELDTAPPPLLRKFHLHCLDQWLRSNPEPIS